MMLMTLINENQIRALGKMGMSLNHFYVLDLLNASRESYPDAIQTLPTIRDVKLLKDRFLIDDKGISPLGQKVYQEIAAIKDGEVQDTKKKIKEVVENRFEEFWDAYPASANFIYRGMSFKSSRALKANKQVCQMLYNSAIIQGIATEDQIINATKFMVEEAKKESFEIGTNKLAFLPGIEVYLRQQKYLAFADVADVKDEDPSDSYWA